MNIFFKRLLIAVLLLFIVTVKSQHSEVDELKKQLTVENNDSIKNEIYQALTFKYLYISVDSSIHYGHEGIQLVENTKYHVYTSKFHSRIGYAYILKNDYLEAKKHLDKALSIAVEYNDKRKMADAYNNLGILYNYETKLHESLLNSKRALDLYREVFSNDQKNGNIIISPVLNNIANIYYNVRHYDEALELYTESVSLIEDIPGQELNAAYSKLNIAYIHEYRKEYMIAKEYLDELLTVFEKENDKVGMSYVYVSLANIYYEFDDMVLAKEYSYKTLSLIDQLNFSSLKSNVLITLSKIYENENIEKSYQYAYQSYEEALKLDIKLEIKEALNRLINVETKRKNYKEAVDYTELFIAYVDTITKESQNKSFVKEQVDLGIKEAKLKTDLELAEIQKENQRKEFELKSRQSTNNMIWLMVVLSLIVIYAVTQVYQKRKLKNILNEKIALENRIGKIEKSIARDLHDNFGSRLSGVLSSYNVIKDINERENKTVDKEKYNKNIESSLILLSKDVKDFLWAMNPENNKFSEILKRLNLIIEQFDNNSNVNIKLNYDEIDEKLLLPKLANRQLLLILKELINNSIKYSQSPVIDINLDIDKNKFLTIECIDYGVGFKREELKRVNGLTHIYERADSIDFNVDMQSEIGKGTKTVLRSKYSLAASLKVV